MGFLSKIPFINNKQESFQPTSTPAQPTLQKKPAVRKPKSRPTPLQGSGGKFASKKPLTKPQASQVTTPSRIQTVTMIGHAIRMFSYDSQRYYCVDDLAKASKMANPEQFLKDFLTKNPKINSELAEVETEKDGQKITLQFAAKEQMTPIIEAIEKVSPKTITLSLKSLN